MRLHRLEGAAVLQSLAAEAVEVVVEGIIPTVNGFPPRTGTAFIVVNDSLVSAETVVSEQQITDPEDVAVFVELHEALASRAAYGAAALALVDGALAHLA